MKHNPQPEPAILIYIRVILLQLLIAFLCFSPYDFDFKNHEALSIYFATVALMIGAPAIVFLFLTVKTQQKEFSHE